MLNETQLQQAFDVNHLYQTIQDLEQENARLRTQLKNATGSIPNHHLNLIASTEAQKCYQQILSIAPVPISIRRVADGRILSVNDLFTSTFGWDSLTAQSCSIDEFYANPLDYQQLLQDLQGSGSVHNCQFQVKRADGSLVWVMISVQRLTIEQETLLLTVFQSISHYKQVEQVLQTQVQRLQQQNLAISHLSHDNSLSSRAFKLALDPMMETVANILDVKQVSVWLHPLLHQSLLDPERLMLWPETTLISASPWLQAMDLPWVCFAQYQQNGDRHSSQQHPSIPPEADSPHQSLQVPIQLGEEQIGQLQIETGETHRIWTVEERNFTNLLAHLIGLILERFERQWAKTALSKMKQQLETQVQKRTIELNHAVQQLRGEMVERIKTESALEQALKGAEAASRAKSTLIANISHEFRTPLHIILGYADMLHEEAREHNWTDILPDVQQIRQAGRKLLNLIEDILDLAKIETGQMGLVWETIHPNLIIHEVVTQVSPLAQKNQNQLRIDCPENIGPICVDVKKLRQILFNLLDNALKFTHQGQVTLTVWREPRDHIHWICFQVTDTGIGIPIEQQKDLFEPFTQVDSSTNRSYEGTGLGLAISQHFCKMLEGEITVSSQPGCGSTFIVYLKANH